MLKRDELSLSTSCFNRAEAEEPVFVLRANDPFAPMTIRHWATMATGSHETWKIDEARKIADAMEEWRKEKTLPEKALPKAG